MAERRQAWVPGPIGRRTRAAPARTTADPAERPARPPPRALSGRAAHPLGLLHRVQLAPEPARSVPASRSPQTRVDAVRAAPGRPASWHHLHHHPARALRAVPGRLQAPAASAAGMISLAGRVPADVAERHSV